MLTRLNDCGCCEGVTAIVPRLLQNRPGLSQAAYRVGVHQDFLRSALAALSDPQFAALRSLTTREPNDFTIALLDGWGTLEDVFTFYQERLANEFWLRTATERDSIIRLAQLIGYRLQGGVAAETPLAFLLDETPGAPAEVAVEIGTKVQSIPGAGEKAQTFETIEALDARLAWNALKPALSIPPTVGRVKSIHLKGTATNLQPGDAILIVGDEREQHPTIHPDKERWDVRVLTSVTPDEKNKRTRVVWERELGKGAINPAAANVRVYAFRQRAALFGHNAPDPALITKPGGGAVGTWSNFTLPKDHIDLDSAYSKIVTGSWLSLTNSDGYVELYKAVTVSFPSRADFALSGKVTRVVPDNVDNFDLFGLRETIVHAQAEPLEFATEPLLKPADGSIAAALTIDPNLLAPLEGSEILLDRLVPPLLPGRKLIVTGKLLRVRVQAALLHLSSFDGSQSVNLKRGDSLVLTARPTLLASNSAKWTLRTNDGFEGTVTTLRSNLLVTAAADDDPVVSESAIVHACAGDPTKLTLEAPLTNLFDRGTVSIAANVADATHGETVTEVLGSGDASQSFQRFKLKQLPLTRIRSTEPGGSASTLQVRVNDLLWHEVPTLYGRGPTERIFTTDLADDGAVTVRFGDGVHGARLPSGAQNVKATYRRGVGLEGLVRANQLSTLLTRPPGLKGAINPLPAEGADDPETFANAQQNAPLTVLTLDRVVSLQDYESFSRAYAGIAKALATYTWDGHTRGVFVTVAGPRGAEISATLRQELVTAIHAAGDPFVPVQVASYLPASFRISAQVAIAADYESAIVIAAVSEALRDAFSFARRRFGQPVVLSEVIALLQNVAGVAAVNVKKFYRTGAPQKLNARLEAVLPQDGPAELLTLDPAPITLDLMT